MLKTLRTSTKWVMITVAVCFVGMMVIGWGMDYSGKSGGGAGVVGVINGQKVMYDYFNQVLQNRRDSMPKDNRMTLDTERKLNDDTWNQIVMQALIDQEIKKRKISYTDKELLNYMLNNPVPGVEKAPVFLNSDGTFSREKYRQFLLNPANLKDPQLAQFLQGVEEQAKSSLPIMKLQQRLAGGVMVPDSKVREQWLQENDKRKLDFVYLPAGQFAGPDQPVDPKQVEAYYNEHKNEYQHENQRSLDFVFFRLAATPADSAEVLSRAKLIVDRARKGENFAELANGYSEDPGNTDAQGKANGGDLGFISRGRLVKEFEDVAFNLKPGEVSDPFMTRFGCHIVKVDSVKVGAPTPDPANPTVKPKAGAQVVTEVRVRHILLKVEPSSQTKDNVENAVNKFMTQVSAKGADFAAAAKKNNLEVMRTPLFASDAQYVPYVGANVSLLVNRTFGAKQGEILPKYAVDSGFFIARVAEIKPAGVSSLAEVKGVVENAVRTQMGVKKAAEVVSRILDRVKSGKTLQEAVAEDELKTLAVRTEEVSLSNAPGLGARNPLVVKAFQLDTIGANTGVVEAANGAGVAVLLEKIPVNEQQYKSELASLRQRMQNELQNEVISQYLENLRKTAKIIDNRSKIFQM